MIAVRSEHLEEMAGDPPLFPVGCAGVIAEEQRLADGRYNIVLVGTFRFRVLHEPERPAQQLYRVARVERLEDAFPPQDSGRVDALRARVIALAADLARRIAPLQAESIGAERFAGIDDAALVNALANAFPFSPPEKQGLLEADSIPERYERLESVLRFQLAEAIAPPAPGPGRLH
jgi:Lon protease-like protein